MAVIIFGIYFYEVNMQPYAILSFATAGGLVAFLIFNFQPAKIFMGDTGSLLLGLINAILVIKFINVANMPDVKDSNFICAGNWIFNPYDSVAGYAAGIWHPHCAIAVRHLAPIAIIFIICCSTGAMSHSAITITLVGVNLFFIVLVYMLRSIDCTWLILGIFAIFFSVIGMLYYSSRRRQMVVVNDAVNKGSSKIVSIAKDAIYEQKN